MGVISIQEAEADLSRLVDRVARGEEIVIARSGRPVAKLVRVETEPRRPGRLKGRIHIADDFDAPLRTGSLGYFAESRSEAAAGYSCIPRVAAGSLPRHHEDPFDRMLIAQAKAEELVLVTRDSAFDSYEVKVLRT